MYAGHFAHSKQEIAECPVVYLLMENDWQNTESFSETTRWRMLFSCSPLIGWLSPLIGWTCNESVNKIKNNSINLGNQHFWTSCLCSFHHDLSNSIHTIQVVTAIYSTPAIIVALTSKDTYKHQSRLAPRLVMKLSNIRILYSKQHLGSCYLLI